MIELRKIGRDNREDCAQLEVHDGQKALLPPTFSALYHITFYDWQRLYGPTAAVYLSYALKNIFVRGFYKSFGFVETGYAFND